MLNNMLHLGSTIINLDNVAYITESQTKFDVYFVDNVNPLTFTRSTKEGRALAHWLEVYVSPMTDGSEAIPIA